MSNIQNDWSLPNLSALRDAIGSGDGVAWPEAKGINLAGLQLLVAAEKSGIPLPAALTRNSELLAAADAIGLTLQSAVSSQGKG